MGRHTITIAYWTVKTLVNRIATSNSIWKTNFTKRKSGEKKNVGRGTIEMNCYDTRLTEVYSLIFILLTDFIDHFINFILLQLLYTHFKIIYFLI